MDQEKENKIKKELMQGMKTITELMQLDEDELIVISDATWNYVKKVDSVIQVIRHEKQDTEDLELLEKMR